MAVAPTPPSWALPSCWGPASPGLRFGAKEPQCEITVSGHSPSMGEWVWQGRGRGVAGRITGAGPIGRCLRGAVAVCRWWCGSLWYWLAALVSPRMAGLRVDFGLLLEPLGFIKVLEWVSGAGDAQREASFSLWGCFFSFPRPGFAPLSWLDGPAEVCADGPPAPWLTSLVVGGQHRAALQPSPLAGREEFCRYIKSIC